MRITLGFVLLFLCSLSRSETVPLLTATSVGTLAHLHRRNQNTASCNINVEGLYQANDCFCIPLETSDQLIFSYGCDSCQACEDGLCASMTLRGSFSADNLVQSLEQCTSYYNDDRPTVCVSVPDFETGEGCKAVVDGEADDCPVCETERTCSDGSNKWFIDCGDYGQLDACANNATGVFEGYDFDFTSCFDIPVGGSSSGTKLIPMGLLFLFGSTVITFALPTLLY